jgi:hypothetical protein
MVTHHNRQSIDSSSRFKGFPTETQSLSLLLVAVHTNVKYTLFNHLDVLTQSVVTCGSCEI